MIVAIFRKDASCPNMPKRNLIVLKLIWIRPTVNLIDPDADSRLGGVGN